jgi:outer membrane protein assembly factor BamB
VPGPDRRSHNPFEQRINVDTVADLELAWTAAVDDGPAGPPVLSSAGVHVSDGTAVYGFDGRTGVRRWNTPPTPDGFEGWYQPVAVDGRVLVARGDTGNRIHTVQWLDAATGAEAGTLDNAAGHVDGVRQRVLKEALRV